MSAFDPVNSATWPYVLTPEQVADIFQRKVGGLKKACQQRRFLPAPFQSHPWRWRKVDLLRHLEGPHHALRRVG